MNVAAAVIFGLLMLAGLVLLIWDRPWRVLDRIKTDDEGRPTDDYPTAQAWHELSVALRRFGDAFLDSLPFVRKDDR